LPGHQLTCPYHKGYYHLLALKMDCLYLMATLRMKIYAALEKLYASERFLVAILVESVLKPANNPVSKARI